MAGPLSDIRVLDLSRVLAGPWAAQNLADLGADVIKVERLGVGDDSRAYAPPFLKDAQGRDTRESAYFCAANRGKRSITVNLTKPEGQNIVRELAKQSDVVIENYKPGDLARYGLGYDDLTALNPGLIYCSVTGFGQTGPYKDRPGYDSMAQGMGGMMSITGERDDLPGGGPQRVGVSIIDLTTGMYATIAICAALAHRAVTGKGQWIDIALLDTCVALLTNRGMSYLATGETPGRVGNVHPNAVPHQTFRTKDGNIILACGNDRMFNKFCEAAGCMHLAQDPRFSTNAQRVRNRDEITRLLNEVFAQCPTREWVELLDAAGVPNGPINTIAEVFADSQVIAREMRRDLTHATIGPVPTIANPMRFSGTPIQYKVAPPMLGQHTDEILCKVLGRSEAEVTQLRRDGVI